MFFAKKKGENVIVVLLLYLFILGLTVGGSIFVAIKLWTL